MLAHGVVLIREGEGWTRHLNKEEEQNGGELKEQ